MPKLTVCRGLPGSGKTSLANKLAEKTSGICIAADDFFTHEDGTYHFNFNLLEVAHNYCIGTAFYHLSRGKNVYVHNVFAERWTVEKFVDFAHRNGYEWDIIEPTTKWKNDVAECAKRNTHGLTEAMIQKMADKWESTKDLMKAFEKYQVE